LNFFSLFKRKIIYHFKSKIDIDTDQVSKNTLDELFYYYGSDKANNFKLNKGHGFSKFYSENLNHLKDKKINILEIGSYAGASAASFKKYFTNSTIFCFDINISNFIFKSKGIHVFGLDIKNLNKMNYILKEIKKNEGFNYFDVIIDDGSHNLSDILFSFKTFFRQLKRNGIYIIEDYKFPNYYDYNKDTNDILVDQMLDKLNKKEFFDSQNIDKKDQEILFEQINDIKTYKGNLTDSDICFITKN